MPIMQFILEQYLPPDFPAIAIWLICACVAWLVWRSSVTAISDSAGSKTYKRLLPELWLLTLLWTVGAEFVLLQAVLGRAFRGEASITLSFQLPFWLVTLSPSAPILYKLVSTVPSSPTWFGRQALGIMSLSVLTAMAVAGCYATIIGIGLRFPGLEVFLLTTSLIAYWIARLRRSTHARLIFLSIAAFNALCTVAAWRYIEHEIASQVEIGRLLHSSFSWQYIALRFSDEPAVMFIPFAVWGILMLNGLYRKPDRLASIS